MSYEIIDYSEKAIVLVGDTKGIKDQLKGLGGRFNPRLSCGAGWIFSKKCEDKLRAMLNGEEVTETKAEAKPKKANGIAPEIKERIKAYYDKVWGVDNHMSLYCQKEIGHACELSNGLILTIEKPSIETHFCFGESGHDYDKVCEMAYNVARTEEYFKNRNLREFDSAIKELKGTKVFDKWGIADNVAYMRITSYSGCEDKSLCTLDMRNGHYGKRPSEELRLSDEDVDRALALYEEARAAFEKRLNAYWKRYGDSKLKTWTYWRDA